ncbi:6-phosphogluconolactonase [Marinitoga hydrogenitolerans DSM 16785]|uniref:6-phosphogluconolactonase n=1 Tax=Marinitoga hydrogenitolerans (strain DSM 16785 / JCM 12826 / AT1271) TaxID=1122195 RepID=A0A1M4S5I7_MARH1|nr:6-phosphogluconolactonase [Marinitoga hydrogenitolerans]SHE27277.1 6-phosphogluconolactonase [Marinitoga hydrogenitolerans DSM 16785]
MRIFEYKNLNNLSFDVAKSIFNFYSYYIKKQNFFTLVLAGGNTPKLLYQILSSQYYSRIDWSKVYIFFGDERYVPVNNDYSNYKMAYENLISKINIPEENIFRIKTEITPIEKCAEDYEKLILNFFKEKNMDISFDLILLGMGNDGHTASIFPDTAISDNKYIDYVFPKNANPNVPRITFTYKTINNSKNVIFLINGEKKTKLLKELLKGKDYPAGKVIPKENLLFFISKN